jgi:Flp pilus assembly pilin Flp
MSIIARLFADQRGTVFVRYSSIALLVAIAAIAVLSRSDGHFLN